MSNTQFPHIFRDFVKNPSVENAKRVSNSFTEDNVREISFMGHEDFVLTSLLTAITEVNVRNKNEIITHLIEAAATFISFSRIKKLVSMQTTLMILIKQIGIGPEFVTVQPNLSEELKLAAIKCIAATFRRLLSDLVEQFYTKTNLRLIANALCISDCIVSKETHRSLRIAGIEAILSIHQLHSEADESDIVLRRQIANLMFILSPKLIKTIADIATDEEILGEMLISRSITALGQILCLLFEEQNYESYQSILEQTKILIANSLKNIPKNPLNFDVLKLPKKSSSVDETIRQFEMKERTDEWLAAAAQKINPIIQRLHKLTGYKSNEIRQKLYQFSNLLLQRCQKHLNGCIPALLEINITLYGEMDQQSSELVFNENIIDIVEQLFMDHLMRLIRVTHTGDEEEQMANILLLRGFIFILSKANRLKITLLNEKILENFMNVLLSMVELDRPMNLLEENNNIYDLTEKRPENVQSLVRMRHNTPWKSFRNLRNTRLIKEIASICECLSANDAVNIIILEYLLELLTKNSINCNEVLVIIQLIINSFDINGSSESLHIVILEEILNEFRWYLATEICDASKPECSNRTWFEDRVEGLYESATIITFSDINTASMNGTNNDDIITIKDIKNNILHMCLTIETVGMYAKRLGQRYQKYMLRSFHRLLEKSASVHYMIRIAALIALNNVKEAFGLNSISQLIFDNADYVSYWIDIYLKRCNQIDVALRMLSIVLHYSSIESMPHLANIIETIVMESVKLDQSKNVLSFMRVFSLILSTIRESMGKDSILESDVHMRPAISNSYLEIWRSILRETDVAEEEVINTNSPEDVQNNDKPMTAIEESESEISQRPPLLQLSINVIKHSIPHFASKNQDIKLGALDCLNHGLDIIKDYDDDLLPIVHSIWDPFVYQCTRDTSPVVLRYCIRLLKKLALYARDFIYRRSADELFPHINSQMIALSKKCTAEKKQILYEHTQEFKLIQELLISLPDILKNIDVQEKQLDDTLNAVVWLLDKNQPQSLQTHCVSCLKECVKFDICAVHLKLLKYHHNDRYKINCQKVLPNQF